MDKAFLQAIRPSSHVVYGLELKPLTIGHIFALYRLVPESIESQIENIGQLAVACFICAQDHSESEKDLKSWWFPFFAHYWAFKCRKLNPVTESLKFEAYLREGTSAPNTKRVVNGVEQTSSLTSPWFFRLFSMLMTDFGMSKSEALQEPVSSASCLWATDGEREGTIQFWTDDDEALWQAATKGGSNGNG